MPRTQLDKPRGSYIKAYLIKRGYRAADIARLTYNPSSTVYKALSDPEGMRVGMLREIAEITNMSDSEIVAVVRGRE